MYQIGISKLIGNYKIPEEYPFPENMLWFWRDAKTKKTTAIEVMNVFSTFDYCETFDVSRMSDLPPKHQGEKLINAHVGVPYEESSINGLLNRIYQKYCLTISSASITGGNQRWTILITQSTVTRNLTTIFQLQKVYSLHHF